MSDFPRKLEKITDYSTRKFFSKIQRSVPIFRETQVRAGKIMKFLYKVKETRSCSRRRLAPDPYLKTLTFLLSSDSTLLPVVVTYNSNNKFYVPKSDRDSRKISEKE
ncbi:hypothetical protein PanWU01x14_280020 [Parasponia andersonii]|uniref:Uncharacterized protein n=1 Tax=Parasponia andersonii TaxID=3476 RepID=A0A2P5B1P7_PARAD|nr:hypothetical protein PanWU01x14_280020 [Parasponia andersonii]